MVFIDELHNNLSVFWKAPVLCLRENARLLLFVLECIVEQLLHKLLTCPIFLFLRFVLGEALCALADFRTFSVFKKNMCFLFILTLSEELPLIRWYCNTKKDVCCCVHNHQAFCLHQRLLISSLF